MATFSIVTFLVALRFLLLVSAAPAPIPIPAVADAAAASSYWVSSIQRQGSPAFGTAGFKVFRNVKDYGAKGDGVSDDTVAINAAVSDGNRCGQGCDSTTTTPAIVYFPPGTYMVSAPIVQYYYTQFIGDAITIPTLKATAGFAGMAVIDADPYVNGNNWFTNQVSLIETHSAKPANME
jgi:glucan 1,3-beta-glucosidase